MLVGSAAALPAVLVGIDVVSRRGMLSARTGPATGGYVAGVVVGMLLWGVWLEAARIKGRGRSRWHVLCRRLTGGDGAGGTGGVSGATHEYFNRQAAVFSIRLWPTILHYLGQSPGTVAAVLLVPAGVVIGVALVRRRMTGVRTAYPRLTLGVAVGTWLFAMFGPLDIPSARRGLPPEVLFWHAAGGLGLSAVGILPKPRALPPGDHAGLPAVSVPVAKDAPSVVLIFGESVRRDEVCGAKSRGCKSSPRVDEAAPRRVGFARSSSVASCTEIAGAVMWTGMSVQSRREEVQSAPLLWDYAKARGYRTGYFTSQNLAFADQALFVRSSRIDVWREARDRDPQVDADIGTPDETTAEEALSFLKEAGGAAFVVVHLSNTHLPYRQVPGHMPYDSGGEDASERRGRYSNSLVHHDAVVGDFVAELRKMPVGERAIVMYLRIMGRLGGSTSRSRIRLICMPSRWTCPCGWTRRKGPCLRGSERSCRGRRRAGR
ncbi:MAG: sulfatase-like hydrolase/transferase [Polyangiaceae bacterium]